MKISEIHSDDERIISLDEFEKRHLTDLDMTGVGDVIIHEISSTPDPDADLIVDAKCFTFAWGIGIIIVLLVLTLIFLPILLA